MVDINSDKPITVKCYNRRGDELTPPKRSRLNTCKLRVVEALKEYGDDPDKKESTGGGIKTVDLAKLAKCGGRDLQYALAELEEEMIVVSRNGSRGRTLYGFMSQEERDEIVASRKERSRIENAVKLLKEHGIEATASIGKTAVKLNVEDAERIINWLDKIDTVTLGE